VISQLKESGSRLSAAFHHQERKFSGADLKDFWSRIAEKAKGLHLGS